MSFYRMLLFLQLKVKLRMNNFRAMFDKKKPAKSIGLLLLILLVVVQVVALYVFYITQLIHPAIALGQSDALLTMILVAGQVIVLIYGAISILNNLFFAKDMEFLLSLPVRPMHIFSAKFTVICLGEVGIMLLFLLPGIIVYGINLNVDAAFYIRSLVVALFAPAIPLAIAAVLSLPLMRIVGALKNRSLAASVVGLVLFAGLMFVSMNMGRITQSVVESGNEIASMLLTEGGLASMIARVFPPALWGARAMAQGGGVGAWNMLLFVGVSLVALAAAFLLAVAFYKKGAVAQLETARSTRKRSKRTNGKVFSQVRSLFVNEWRSLLRTPTYAMNALTTIIIGPLMLLLMSDMLSEIPAGVLKIVSGEIFWFIVLIVAAIVGFFAAINPAAATTLTREGKTYYLLKTLPIDPKQLFKAKLLVAYSISFGAAALFLTAPIFVGVDFSVILLGVILAMIISFPCTALSMLIDMNNPKLNWTTPQQAIKQNFNAFLGMLVSWALMGFFGLAAYLMLSVLGAPAAAVYSTLVLLGLLISILSYRLLMSKAADGLRRLGQ